MFKQLSIIREIGSEYEYSNLAQGLLGHILLSLVAKDSYENLVLKKIAQPLGMKETKIVLDDPCKKKPGRWTQRRQSGRQLGHSTCRCRCFAFFTRHVEFMWAQMQVLKKVKFCLMDLAHRERHSKQLANRVRSWLAYCKGAQGDVVWHTGGTGRIQNLRGFCKGNWEERGRFNQF
ncbi:MAG: serine hydrolase [Saprospiraceae bacterium]|nr:serine hydrolase [Saprospiraceae bacterium]